MFRVNCVDCLDRTGVVQSMISQTMITLQLFLVLGSKRAVLTEESELSFKRIWADNADAISKQYSVSATTVRWKPRGDTGFITSHRSNPLDSHSVGISWSQIFWSG